MPLEFRNERSVDLDFQVIDRDSGQPVAGAFVRISNPFAFGEEEPPIPMALTGPDGRVRLTGRFPVVGIRNAFRSLGTFSPWGRWLKVSAVGHQTLRIALPEVLGPHIELERTRRHRVALVKGVTPEGSFRDIAGVYAMPGSACGGIDVFVIEPDGRFAWSIASCVPPDFEQYGYLKRNKREIELARIRHRGAESDGTLSSTIRVLGWDGELYLTSKEDRGLGEFCRAALDLRLRSDREETHGGYKCVAGLSSVAKPTESLPRIPVKVWVKFLVDELSLQNEDGLLKLALKARRSNLTDPPAALADESSSAGDLQ